MTNSPASTPTSPSTSTPDLPEPDFHLWLQWVLANAGAELIGLGGSAAVLVGFNVLSQNVQAVVDVLLMALVAILLGTFFEGIVVGFAQWHVLRRALPRLSRGTWVTFTAAGAGVAWLLGMIPSTLIAISQVVATPDAVAQTPTEPSDLAMMLGAAVMGLVLGAVLGYPQHLALARHVHGSGWWVLANALAWVPGMMIVFYGAGSVPAGGLSLTAIAIIAASTLVAGAVVGAVHGAALIQLVRHRRSYYRARQA